MSSTTLRDDASETVRGIAVVCVGYVFMTMSDVAGKWALLPAGIAAVMVARGVGGAATMLVVSRGRGLRPVRWRLVALRSVLHSVVSIAWYAAWQVIPLADAYAFGFTAPLLMTVLAVPMLGERLRWRRMLSTLVGFCGVLVMVRPGSTLWNPVMLILAPGIVGMAISRIMTRQLSTTETPASLTFWLMLAHVPAGLVLGALPFGAGFGGIDAGVLVGLALVGVFNGGAHCLLARGYGLAPVSAVAPYEYTLLIWGVIAGWLVFHEVPASDTLWGAAVVAASGLYNLHRERVRRGMA